MFPYYRGSWHYNVKAPVPLDSGVTEYLATNLLDNTLSAQDFKDLDCLRWPIESKYNELKNQILISIVYIMHFTEIISPL